MVYAWIPRKRTRRKRKLRLMRTIFFNQSMSLTKSQMMRMLKWAISSILYGPMPKRPCLRVLNNSMKRLRISSRKRRVSLRYVAPLNSYTPMPTSKDANKLLVKMLIMRKDGLLRLPRILRIPTKRRHMNLLSLRLKQLWLSRMILVLIYWALPLPSKDMLLDHLAVERMRISKTW
jgi:hypothetical protein